MIDDRAVASLVGGVTLLERAIAYTLGSLKLVTPAALPRRTPCQAWDLHALLAHMNDSMLALCEAADLGGVSLQPPPPTGEPAVDLVETLKARACRLLGAWTNADGLVIAVADLALTSGVVAGAGAVEVTVHGWDVARACGHDRPIPAALAEELLDLVPLFVTGADRPIRFAAPVTVPWSASPGDRLVAFLGRDPG